MLDAAEEGEGQASEEAAPLTGLSGDDEANRSDTRRTRKT